MRCWFAGLIVLMACTGNGTEAVGARIADEPVPARAVVANISYQDIPTNLIVNGDFEDYADRNVPDSWTVDEIYGYRGMFAPVDGWRGLGVQLVRNAQGQHRLAQVVQVQPNQRYTAQLVYRVDATDASRGGLYVADADGTVLASDTINRPTNGWRIATVTFDSGERTQVVVELGYPAGMNGTVIYDAVSLFAEAADYQLQYQTSYRDAIGIPAMPVDDLVPLLSDYVTTMLAASRADRLAHRDAYAAELPYYFHRFLDAPDGSAGRSAWCQHTSLALAELLAMYGVATRQIHATAVEHQFLEYFDGRTWVAFDPYYGIRYVLAGQRLGVTDIARAGMDQVSIEVPTQKHVFLLELGYLKPIWQIARFNYGIAM